jgi:hypothetical protein
MHAFNIYISLVFLLSITYLSMIAEKQWGFNAHTGRGTKKVPYNFDCVHLYDNWSWIFFIFLLRTVRLFLQGYVSGPLQKCRWNRWIMNWYNDLGIFSYVWNDTDKHLLMYDAFLRSRKVSKFCQRSSRVKCPLNS